MSEPKNRRSSRAGKVGLGAALLIVAIAFLMFAYRQTIYDHLMVWQYQPAAEVSELADRTEMTDKGRFYFYASRPAIEGGKAFNDSCSRQEEHTAILGCYNGIQIFIYDVTDERLDGIREVTAAHEMLHAAYLRLSSGERERVDALLYDEYESIKGSKELADRMAFYERTEPGEQANELHSIIGTEVEKLSGELEDYYARFFTDRQKVVSLHRSYVSVFDNLNARASELSTRIESLSTAINRDTEKYNAQVSQLNDDIGGFNDRARGNGFQSQSQFQSERSSLVARVNELESLRKTIDSNAALRDKLYTELEGVSSQADTLNRSIDSTLAPAPSI